MQGENGWVWLYFAYKPSEVVGPHQLGLATSSYGVTWVKQPGNPVFDLDEKARPLSNLLLIGDTYHLYYDLSFGKAGIGLLRGRFESEAR